MLTWAGVFFVVSIIAAIFGFTGISAAAAGVAKVLFFVFVTLFVITLVAGFVIGKRLVEKSPPTGL